MSGTMGAMGAMGAMGVMGAMGAISAMGTTHSTTGIEWNPLLADALIRSRGALVDEPGSATHAPKPLLRKLDDPQAHKQWSAQVRMYTLLFDLLCPLKFTHDNKHTATIAHGQASIASLTRPSESAFYTKQTKLVESWAELREERLTEIVSQLTPQFAFWEAITHAKLERRPKTLELMWLAITLTSYIEMRFKHAFAVPRPYEFSPHVQPVIATPGHGSYPSGHATEAFMMAHLLTHLLPNGLRYQSQLQQLAARTSINRTVAGVHFPVDSEAGRVLGTCLGEYVVCMARQSGKWHSRSFEPAHDGSHDFDASTTLPKGHAKTWRAAYKQPGLSWLWAAAEAELAE
jgi:PAP2 superfamily